MPVKTKKNRKGGWDIVEVSSGRKIGHARSKRKAEVSVYIRNKAIKKSRKHG